MDFEEIYKIKLRYSKKKRRIKLCYRRDFVMVILIDIIELNINFEVFEIWMKR